MEFKEIEYQDKAVKHLRDLLDDAWTDYETSVDKVAQGKRTEARTFAVYLSALTGAGKTVMAGRLIEKILDESDAAVLWLSDSPMLNFQTRYKLEAIIEPSRLRMIDKVGFNEGMESGHVYFMNPQKLGKQKEGGEGEKDMLARWKFLQSGLDDPTLKLYVIHDEAHRGVTKKTKTTQDDETDDKILVSIFQATSEHLTASCPAPVVLGISATPDRFKAEMEARGRTVSGHKVDPKDIQDSGLIKRDIDYRTPPGSGTDRKNLAAQLSMLDTAVEHLRKIDDGWATFHNRESLKDGFTGHRVVPLLLFQVPDNSSDDEIAEWVGHLNEAWDRHYGHNLPSGAVAHVLQSGKQMEAGPYTIPYCPPQDVEKRTAIRVLIAKLAITTGWDCPRAEVLFSMRGADDATYIAQLIGRMVRMPLAERSLSGDLDLLNVARVLLPYFNTEVVDRVTKGLRGDEVGPTPQLDMVAITENPDITQSWGREPFDLVSGLKKLPAPTGAANPILLMHQLGVMVSTDSISGVGHDPYKTALGKLYAILDEYATNHADELDQARKSLDTEQQTTTLVKGWATAATTTHGTTTAKLTPYQRRLKVDRLVASMPGELGLGYRKHLVAAGMSAAEAGAVAASLAQLPTAMQAAEAAARQQAEEWLKMVESAMRADEAKPVDEQKFAESRKIEYRRRMAQFGDPVETNVGVLGPRVVSFGPEGKRYPHGWKKHLFVEPGGDGLFRLDIGSESWEKHVLDKETARDEVVAWYRNPGSGAEHTLQVAWRDGTQWRSAHPDFVFVERVNGELKPSVVDPHDPDRDGLPRLRGLASFAERYGSAYGRFWTVGNTASGDKALVSLDLLDASVRSAVMAEGADAHELYKSYGKAYL